MTTTIIIFTDKTCFRILAFLIFLESKFVFMSGNYYTLWEKQNSGTRGNLSCTKQKLSIIKTDKLLAVNSGTSSVPDRLFLESDGLAQVPENEGTISVPEFCRYPCLPPIPHDNICTVRQYNTIQ